MENKKVSVWLMAAGGAAAAVLAFFFLVMLPIEAVNVKHYYPELAYLFWPLLISLWIIGACYALSMLRYFQICLRIGKNQSFCRENAKDLGRIALYLGLAGALCLVWDAAAAAQSAVSVGIWCLYPFLAAMASFGLAVLAWGLGKLLARAVALKEENDLTV